MACPWIRAGLVLRHRSIDMTAYYAKADVELLKQIAQPWPEVIMIAARRILILPCGVLPASRSSNTEYLLRSFRNLRDRSKSDPHPYGSSHRSGQLGGTRSRNRTHA